jgi:hypothetical protein
MDKRELSAPGSSTRAVHSTPIFPVEREQLKRKTGPTPSPNSVQPNKVISMAPMDGLFNEDQLAQIYRLFQGHFLKLEENTASLTVRVSELEVANNKFEDRIAALEAKVSSLEKNKAEIPVQVVSPGVSSVAPLQQLSSDGARRSALLGQIKRNCELLVLNDSQWRGINVGKFGRTVGLFAYTVRCSTLDYVPDIVPTLVGEIDTNRLKGVVISTGVNDAESIGVAYSDDPRRIKELQLRITKAISAVARAWPDVPIFIEVVSPMFEMVPNSDRECDAIPRTFDSRFEFARDSSISYEGATLVINPDYVGEGIVGISVFERDGKHVGECGSVVKADCLAKGILSVLPKKPSGVSFQLRPVFDELRTLRVARQTVSAQGLLASAFASMKALMEQNPFVNQFPPLPRARFSNALVAQHPNPGVWGGGYGAPMSQG